MLRFLLKAAPTALSKKLTSPTIALVRIARIDRRPTPADAVPEKADGMGGGFCRLRLGFELLRQRGQALDRADIVGRAQQPPALPGLLGQMCSVFHTVAPQLLQVGAHASLSRSGRSCQAMWGQVSDLK